MDSTAAAQAPSPADDVPDAVRDAEAAVAALRARPSDAGVGTPYTGRKRVPQMQS